MREVAGWLHGAAGWVHGVAGWVHGVAGWVHMVASWVHPRMQAGCVGLERQSSTSRRSERSRDTSPPSGWGWERGEEGEAVRMTHARPSAVSSSATWLGLGLG